MTREKFIEIMDSDSGSWNGDNAFQGLVIMAKYISPETTDIICAAEHDEIYGPDIDKLIEAGITEDDVIKLRDLNWMIDRDCDCLACFV
jgi:hypothetical protein